MNIFGIHLEFDHLKFRKTIEEAIARKTVGYVCVVDGNVLSQTYFNENYRDVVRGAVVNTCDGSYIAKMCNDIYHTSYSAFSGPEIFKEFIEKPYRQLLVGNTELTFNKIKSKLEENGKNSESLFYMPLQFAGVDDFKYKDIATEINELKPDIIWVSLGAPKQELFMSRLKPFLEAGVMFGIGAAFNYYAGILSEPEAKFGSVRLLWLARLFEEPRKQLPRCWNFIKVIPALKRKERKLKASRNDDVLQHQKGDL